MALNKVQHNVAIPVLQPMRSITREHDVSCPNFRSSIIMDHKSIRERTVEEDSLLGSRTTAFLIGNGFVLTALGSTQNMPYSWVIAVFGFLLSIVWLTAIGLF